MGVGRSGEQQYGALSYPTITPQLKALISSGRVISLQQPLRIESPQWEVQPQFGVNTVLTHDQSTEMMRQPVTSSFERIEHSGHSGTHIDALCHVGCFRDGQPYLHGDVPARTVQTQNGHTALGAEHFPPIILRGIMLDIPAAKGLAVLPDLYEVTAEDLQLAEDRQNVLVTHGSAVLVRTGFDRYWEHPEHYMSHGPGPGLEAARYLAAKGASVVGADTANFEVLAFPDLPAHMHLIYEHGIPIVENLRLAELAQERFYEFLFFVLPIAFSGSTGTQVHPIAVC